MLAYHDDVWGRPEHDDTRLFELLTLEAFQSGLSWRTILDKQANFERAFDHFDIRAIASYGKPDVERLLNDRGIVRNRMKIEATITNARAVVALDESGTSFDAYIWNTVDGAPIAGGCSRLSDLLPKTDVSAALAKRLKSDGFRFVGPTTAYSFMQAAGLVNDHLVGCFRYGELIGGL